MQTFMATGRLNLLTDTMTVLGLIVVGALTASFVSCTLPIQIVKDVYDATTNTILESQVLFNADSGTELHLPADPATGPDIRRLWFVCEKKWSPLKLMGLILVLACALTFIGYATGFYA